MAENSEMADYSDVTQVKEVSKNGTLTKNGALTEDVEMTEKSESTEKVISHESKIRSENGTVSKRARTAANGEMSEDSDSSDISENGDLLSMRHVIRLGEVGYPVSIACNTPAPLKQISAYKLADVVLANCVPETWHHDHPFKKLATLPRKAPVIPVASSSCDPPLDPDDLLLASREFKRHLLKAKESLILMLRAVKEWWDETRWLGPLDSPLQREIREAFSVLLDSQDSISLLYKVLLQILFTNHVGRGPLPSERCEGANFVVVHKEFCLSLGRMLESLAPFALEEVNTFGLEFKHPYPLITIIKKSPMLRIIRLENNATDYVLEHIGRYSNCTKLEELTSHSSFSEKCLFRSFFCGMNKNAVLENVGNKENVKLSFPNLRSIHGVWHDGSPKLFPILLLHYYTQIHTLTDLFHDSINLHLLLPDFFKHIFRKYPRSPSCVRGVATNDYCMEPKLIQAAAQTFTQIEHFRLCDWVQPDPNILDPNWPSPFAENLVADLQRIKANPTGLVLSHCIHAVGGWTPFKLDHYIPYFSTMGATLNSLTVRFNTVDASDLCELINECPNLETLRIVVVHDIFGYDDRTLELATLSRLKTLAVWSHKDNDSVDPTFLQSLVSAAPNITSFEMNTRELDVCISLVYCGKLEKVETLCLIGDVYCTQYRYLDRHDPPTDFKDSFVEFVEALPSVKTLMLYMVQDDINIFRKLYKNTALEIIDGRKLHHRETTQHFIWCEYQLDSM